MSLNRKVQHQRSKYYRPRRWLLALRLSLGSAATSIVLAGSLTGRDRAAALPPDLPPTLPADTEAQAAPPTEWQASEEIPEEILRTEIITEARSPLTGEVISAAEYAQLQETLAAPAGEALVSEDLQYLIFLLQFRRALKPIIPFL